MSDPHDKLKRTRDHFCRQVLVFQHPKSVNMSDPHDNLKRTRDHFCRQILRFQHPKSVNFQCPQFIWKILNCWGNNLFLICVGNFNVHHDKQIRPTATYATRAVKKKIDDLSSLSCACKLQSCLVSAPKCGCAISIAIATSRMF